MCKHWETFGDMYICMKALKACDCMEHMPQLAQYRVHRGHDGSPCSYMCAEFN